MGNLKKFELINGKFLTEESSEILQNIFASKIQFHQMKNFSSQERFGKDDEQAKQRILQLTDNLNEVMKFIKEAEKNNEFVEINSEIIIHVQKK